MDMGFLRRAERMLTRERVARIDHEMLVAALATRRQVEVGNAGASSMEPPAEPVQEPLVELVLAGPDWRRALSAQGGCFSRAEAGRRVNDP
jgi:hypothetical protein